MHWLRSSGGYTFIPDQLCRVLSSNLGAVSLFCFYFILYKNVIGGYLVVTSYSKHPGELLIDLLVTTDGMSSVRC